MQSSMPPHVRRRMLLKNMEDFIKTYSSSTDMDIKIRNLTDTYEHFIIRFVMNTGYYAGQVHYIELKTIYGADPDIYIFPIQKPLIRFLTNMWHPNISLCGSICVDFLTDDSKWVATYKFSQVLQAVFLLLTEPNCDSPFNVEAAKQFMAMSGDGKDNAKTLYANKCISYYSPNNHFDRLFAKSCDEVMIEIQKNISAASKKKETVNTNANASAASTLDK